MYQVGAPHLNCCHSQNKLKIILELRLWQTACTGSSLPKLLPCPLQEGFGEFQVCQERGVRADAHRQYLKPVIGRNNLTVMTKARTLGISLESARGEPMAKGVSFSISGPDSDKHQGASPFLNHHV